MKKLALGLWVAQVLATIVMLAGSLIEIETIIGTGPALSIIGLTLAVVTRRLNSWEPIAFGLSGPLICALAATLIAVYEWGPREAQRPIPWLLVAYLVSATPLAVLALRSILRWHVMILPNERRAWQFSMKALLVWMTAVCLLAAVVHLFVQRFGRSGSGLGSEKLLFLIFAAATVALSGTVLWRYLAKRRQPK